MAFPLEKANLISHLRSSYLAQFPNDDDARRMIRPYPHDPDSNIYKPIFDKYILLGSPPIQLDTTDQFQSAFNSKMLSKNHKTKSKIRHKRQGSKHSKHKRTKSIYNDLTDDETAFFNNLGDKQEQSPQVTPDPKELAKDTEEDEKLAYSLDENEVYNGNLINELTYTPTIKKEKKKNNIIRLFQRENKNGYDSDSSEGSIRTTRLDNDSDDSDGTDSDLTDNSETTQKMSGSHEVGFANINNDVTITPDPSQELSEVADELAPGLASNSTESFNPDNTLDSHIEDRSELDSEQFDDDYEDEDDDDDDEENDITSTDSAFTDIDGDSMLDPSLLLDSFDEPEFGYTKKSDVFTSKIRKKKERASSFNTFNSAKHSTRSSRLNTDSSSAALTNLKNSKKQSIKFEKIIPPTVETENKSSNLSSLIQSRHKNANQNPLSFYSFANDEISSPTIKKVQLDVFVPPRSTPTLKNIPINSNVAVSDCIGYILLHLSTLSEFQVKDFSLNPNHWRLELVDEDGENYGSFGILDRTRLLSSYNNPRELAICKVTDEKEVKRNEKQSPLALEFKQNLLAYERRNALPSNEEPVVDPVETMELTIVDMIGNKAYMVVDNKSTVYDVLNQFCGQHGLNSENYAFKLLSNPDGSLNKHDIATLAQSLTLNSKEGAARALQMSEVVKELESTTLEIIPSKGRHKQSPLNHSSNLGTFLDHTISPMPRSGMITPPVHSGTLPRVSNTSNKVLNAKSNRKAQKAQEASDEYFDSMIPGMSSQFPSYNPKTRYFQWKVWRKKATIINRIEKALIIDGDYIRLQPPEDKAYIKNTSDNPFLATEGASHHHHLHHYNYSNYYNSSMLKTSSFHITQIVKVKQYKNSKNSNHFKIVVQKDSNVKKKYDLEAVSEAECHAIIEKIKYVSDLYHAEMANVKQ